MQWTAAGLWLTAVVKKLMVHKLRQVRRHAKKLLHNLVVVYFLLLGNKQSATVTMKDILCGVVVVFRFYLNLNTLWYNNWQLT